MNLCKIFLNLNTVHVLHLCVNYARIILSIIRIGVHMQQASSLIIINASTIGKICNACRSQQKAMKDKNLKIVYQTKHRKDTTCFTGLHRRYRLPLNKPQWQ